MTSRRTDNPRKLTVLLSAEAHRLIDALAEKLSARDGHLTRTDVIERAIRALAKAERVN